MKRFAPLLLLLLAACQGTPVTSPVETPPSATLKKSTSCALSGYTWTTIDESRHAHIKFHTTECASDVNVKVYLIHPGEPLPEPGQGFLDGRRQPIGVVDAPAFDIDPQYPWFGTPHVAVIRLPRERTAYPEHWDTTLWVEVRSGGTMIGSFQTVDDGTPD